MYDYYTGNGDPFESFTFGFGQKQGLLDYHNAHPEYHFTDWLWDGYWDAYVPYRDMFGHGNYVPQNFVIDQDGYVRWGKVGSVSYSEMKAIIDELL
jgi:hypothetical protein